MYETPMYMIKKNKKESFLYGDKRAKMKMTVVEEQINQEDLKAEESEEDEKENSKDDKSHSIKNKNKNSSIGTSIKDEDKVMNFSFGRQGKANKKRTETLSQENEIEEHSPSRNNITRNKSRSRYSKTNESPSRSNDKSENKIESEYSTPNGEMGEIDEENYESSKNQGAIKSNKKTKNKKYYDNTEEEEESEEEDDEENENDNDIDNIYNNYNRDKDMNTVSEVEENEFYEGNTQYMSSKNYGNYDYGDSVSEKESMEDFPNMMNIFKEDPNKEKKEKEEQKRILEITEAFNLFDKDCDGNIDIRELATVMRTLGYNPNKDELDDIIKTFDEDESGTIDKDEFINLLTTKLKEQKEDKDLLEIFNMFDKNRDGYITEDDINYIIDEIGEDIDEDIVTELIKKGDDDNDSRINFIEFKKIFIGKKHK